MITATRYPSYHTAKSHNDSYHEYEDRVFSAKHSSPGKITLINGLNQMVRAHLNPTVDWGHFEHRTNQTLSTNPRKHESSQTNSIKQSPVS